jgi:hypothetical protein
MGVAAAAGSAPATLDSRQATTSCFALNPIDTVTDRLNAAFNATGAAGLSIQLCPDTNYVITSPILFAFPNQELTTQGFPGLDLIHRAIITVDGPVYANGTGHTTAVDGSCNNCSSVALRYVEIDGNRGSGPIVGGGNIEFGSGNQNQIVEYVHSHNPRPDSSCLSAGYNS